MIEKKPPEYPNKQTQTDQTEQDFEDEVGDLECEIQSEQAKDDDDGFGQGCGEVLDELADVVHIAVSVFCNLIAQ